MKLELKDGQTLLFFGDSITDAERLRDNGADLGKGFVRLLASYIGYRYPDRFIKIINRGIGGDNIMNLWERLETDCINFSPDIVSILVGLNDTTFRLWDMVNNTPFSPDEFEDTYIRIVKRIREANSDCKIILATPYLVEMSAEHRINKQLLRKYVPIIEKIAELYDCTLIPLYQEFEKKIQDGYGRYYTCDGVHPTESGAFFIADTWCKYVLGERIVSSLDI